MKFPRLISSEKLESEIVGYITGADLESLRAVFNEKEKELSLAVAKVDELTRQLEDLRRSTKETPQPSPAAVELEKLKRELLVSGTRPPSLPLPCYL